jgi:hypothetical protein
MPMLIFPDYSDFSNVSEQTRMFWQGEFTLRQKYKRYFTGDVFDEKVPLEYGLDEEALMFPAGVNLVKMITTAQADSVFGEWEDSILTFQPRSDEEVRDADKAASRLARDILMNSNANSMLWEIALDREVYGGGVIKIRSDIQNPGHIKWERVPLESFFPIWDPSDPNRLLEVYVVYQITKDQALAKYGYSTDADLVTYAEHWTEHISEYYLDKKKIDAYSGVNPWGVVPFVYIPRLRSTHWWGDSLTEDLIMVQDELNIRLADLGEAISYNAQPVRWGRFLGSSFNPDNFPIGPNVLWDLGSGKPGQELPPEVGFLEAKKPDPRRNI